MKINTLSPDTQDFLQILVHIAKSPKKLHYIGALPESRVPAIAIIGTRKPTSYGKEVTYRFAYELAKRGIVIVSGLALGVDAIAHKAALDSNGTTIAVLGNGLPSIQPSSNRQLGESIIEKGGAILSEYDSGTPARSYHFLERNRIVSGLSDGVLITEAAARSGTLNTAARALEQGKNVYVIPGNITSAMSVGCNQLIKQGAIPVTSPDDILDVLSPRSNGPQQLPLGSTPLESKIITLIAEGIRDGDELQQRSDVSATELSTTLTMLELNGAIRALGGNRWTLR